MGHVGWRVRVESEGVSSGKCDGMMGNEFF